LAEKAIRQASAGVAIVLRSDLRAKAGVSAAI
jgi:hypothetical protein